MKKTLVTLFLASSTIAFSALAGPGSINQNQQNDRLLELTRSSDAQIRITAVRSLRSNLSDHKAKGRILEMAGNPKESIEVRRECLKALTHLPGDRDAAIMIKAAAFDNSWPRPLKILGFKALYHIVVLETGTRRDLLLAATRGDDVELREAAIWGLHEASRQHIEVKKDLLLMTTDRETTPIRIAALKSLYLAMTQLDVKDRMLFLASDRKQDAALRYGAVLALSALSGDRSARMALETLTKDNDPQIQRAAVLAMGDPGHADILVYFHFAYRRGSSGPFSDPLDAE